MAHPRSKEYRLLQILRYLEAHYHTPYPVQLQFTRVPMKHERGATTRSGRKLFITINLRADLFGVIDCLLHEYAHALTWRHDRIERNTDEDHPPEWGIALAKLWTHMFDEYGMEKSREY